MATAADTRVAAEHEPRARAAEERLVAALPLATVFTWLALVWSWHAWLIPSPMIFGDELVYTQIARSLADTGEATLRGAPHHWRSLAVVARAPAWLIGDAQTAYLVAKLIGVLAMTATVFPAYVLARLMVGRRAALFAAAASASVPALAYSGLLLEEPIAYPYATLALAAGVHALARPSPRAVALALALAAFAPLVRRQLLVVPLALAVAAVTVAWTDERVRRRRGRIRPWDSVALAVAALAAVVVGHRFASAELPEWVIAAARPAAIVDHALFAAGALAIGVGIVPVVAGIAAVLPGPGEGWTPARRAFAATFASTAGALLLYTGGKGAWLELMLESRVLERNLVYLAPFLFTGLAVWLERPRIRPLAVLAGAAVAALVLRVVPIELGWPYFEAPGFSILTAATRELGVAPTALRPLLVVLLAVTVVVVLLPHRVAGGRPGLVRGLLAGTAAFVLLWNVAGAVATSAGQRSFGSTMLAEIPSPPDWVDRAVGASDVLYLGQSMSAAETASLEFWNRRITAVGSLDATAPGPGPVFWPALGADGSVNPAPGGRYVLLGPGLEAVGERVAARGDHEVVRLEPPLRLRQLVLGVHPDTWMSAFSSFTRFVATDDIAVNVTLSLPQDTPRDRPTVAVLRIGPVAVDIGGAGIARYTGRRRVTLHPGRSTTVTLPAPRQPFRVEVTVSPTVVPNERNPFDPDRRALGAQIEYNVAPRG